jgi:outer membrane protein assembly factor BamB
LRRLLALAAVVPLTVACGAAEEASEPAPPPAPVLQPTGTPKRLVYGFVTVVDGDTRAPVRGAAVRIGKTAARVDRRGVAAVPLGRRAPARVRVWAPGYIERALELRLRSGRRHRISIYRRDLQWPLYGANPARTQVHPAIRLRPPFRAVWQRGMKGLVEFPAVVWEGVAYLNNISGVLRAIDMRNGRTRWRARVGRAMASSPAVDPERSELVVTSKVPGYANVVDMRTGRIEWRYYIGAAEPSPVVRDSVAYVASAAGKVFALDLDRRRPRWIASGAAKITSSPALAGNRLYVADYAGRVFALNARTGRRLWTASARSKVYGTVAVAGGRVFAPSVGSGLSAFSARSGRFLWRIPVGAYLYSSPAVYRGRVYFGTYAGVVYCASAATGRILWTRGAGGAVSGAIQVVAGLVYAGSFGHRITAWHWRTGREVWRFPHGEYVPVSGNGGRLLMHGFSRIWAVEPKKRRR